MRPADCPDACPGCPHGHFSAGQSADRKTRWLKTRLSKWADRMAPMRYPVGGDRLGYRDKTCLSARWDAGGWHIGLNVGEAVIDISGCPVHTRRVNAAVQRIVSALPPGPDFPLVYFVTAGALVTLVVKCRKIPDLSWFDADMEKQLAAIGIRGLWLHRFASAGKKVFAKTGWHLLWGSPSAVDADGFVYGPTAFRQVAPALHGRVIADAETFLAPGPGDRIIDLYSGIGVSLARWTGRGAGAAGVELSGEAVTCARQNAPGAVLYRGTCAQRIPQLDAWRRATDDAERLMIYANPPRTGLETDTVKWLIRARPRKLAYLSCSAATLGRDLECLEDGGFRVERIMPYDFFPQTRHVETLATLERAH